MLSILLVVKLNICDSSCRLQVISLEGPSQYPMLQHPEVYRSSASAAEWLIPPYMVFPDPILSIANRKPLAGWPFRDGFLPADQSSAMYHCVLEGFPKEHEYLQ